MAAPEAMNDGPSASYTVNENDILTITGRANGVLANDTDADPGDQSKLVAKLQSSTANPLFNLVAKSGTFTYDANYNGDLWYDPNTLLLSTFNNGGDDILLEEGLESLGAGDTAYDTFAYVANDGQDDSLAATVTITILGVNDDPVAFNDDIGIVPQTNTNSIDVTANDTDVDINTDLIVTQINGVPVGANDSVVVDGHTLTLEADLTTISVTAADEVFGVWTVPYTVSDGDGGSATATLRFTVTPDNEPPVAADDLFYTVGEDDAATTFGTSGVTAGQNDSSVLNNDTDPDPDDQNELGAELVLDIASALRRVDGSGNTIAGNTGILVDFNADGSFVYNPNGEFESLGAGETAFVEFDYYAFDAEGGQSMATARIQINGANDPITANIPGQENTVYEAGLATGSGVGPTDTMRTFSFLTELSLLKTDTANNPDGDTVFLVPIVAGTDPVEGSTTAMPGDTINEANGFWTLLDLGDNATGALYGDGETPDGLIDSVKYTFNSNNTGHNDDGRDSGRDDGLDAFLELGISDGTRVGDATSNYQLVFGASGEIVNTTNATIEKIDDIPVIDPNFTVGAILIDETTGVQAGTNDVADPGVGQRAALVEDIVDLTGSVIDPGADGLESGPITELTDSTGADFNGTATNLFDTETKNRIFLYDNGGNGVVGRVGTGTLVTDASVTGAVAFTITLENQVDARLIQDRAVFHADATNPDDTATLTAADGSALIHVTVTVNDGDVGATDEVTQTGNNALVATFRDDKPTLTSIESGFADWVVDIFEGAATGLDFGFDGAGFVDLASFSPSIDIFDTDGVLITTVTGTEGPDNTVLYEEADGDDFFAFRLDSATGNYEFEILVDAPLVENRVNLGGEKAGAPEARVEFTTQTGTTVGIVAVDGIDEPGDNADDPNGTPSGDVKTAINAADLTALLNASNKGLGVENQNADPTEGFIIDTSVPSGGVVFTIAKPTGGIKGVSFKWEAYDAAGLLVDEGTEFDPDNPGQPFVVPNTNNPANFEEVRIELAAGVEATTYFIAPEIVNDKGGFNIPTLSILERGAVADFEFALAAEVFDEDGDPGSLVGDVEFVVGVNADGNAVYDGTTALVNELDMA